MRAGLARMAAALRPAITVIAAVAAIAGAVPPVSWAWLGPALALVCLWTPVYVAVAWTRGLRLWLVGCDLVVAAALCAAIGHLVPRAALTGTTSWVALAAAMTVISAQLGGRLAWSLPGGLLVVASEVAGQRLAHAADGGMTALWLGVPQLLLAAGAMALAMYVERTSIRALNRLQEAREAAAVAMARREEERALLRFVHNGPLTTLTIALQAGASGTLRHRAAATLEGLPRLAAESTAASGAGSAPDPGDMVRLDERLSQVVVWYEPPLRLTARLHPCSVPPAVADAITGAVSEALENVTRYAATREAEMRLFTRDGVVRVTVTDHGRGFDPSAVPGFGVREDLGGRLAAVGGTAAVRSRPGIGTVVELGWRHD